MVVGALSRNRVLGSDECSLGRIRRHSRFANARARFCPSIPVPLLSAIEYKRFSTFLNALSRNRTYITRSGILCPIH